MLHESEFYVGYLPMPAGLRRTIRRVVVGLGVAALFTAALLVLGQHPFAPSHFEFQDYREFEGTLLDLPYPALAIPGEERPWLLVGPGKHGVTGIGALAGKIVHLRGERIYQGRDHMIEVLPDSLRATGGVPAAPHMDELGHVSVTGEIVDSKCYFGVMNPGQGKVHRDCAARCISGGIPPALLVRDADGVTETIVLANWKREWLDHVAEPVTIGGRLVRSNGRLVLYAE